MNDIIKYIFEYPFAKVVDKENNLKYISMPIFSLDKTPIDFSTIYTIYKSTNKPVNLKENAY